MGKHYLLNLYGCEFDHLNDLNFIIETLNGAANLCGATILNVVSHQFEPNGITVILLLAESHISFHSWPEQRTAACDVYTCSKTDPRVGCLFIIEKLHPINHKLTFIQR
jgi:S-adenosylmethionine decarboxylase